MTEQTVDIATARKNLGQIIGAGGTVTITKYGKPVALITPYPTEQPVQMDRARSLRANKPIDTKGNVMTAEQVPPDLRETDEERWARLGIKERLTPWELKYGKGKQPND